MARYQFCSSGGEYTFRRATIGNILVEIYSAVRPIVTSIEIRYNQQKVIVTLTSAGDWSLPEYLRKDASMSRDGEIVVVTIPFSRSYHQDSDVAEAVLTCLRIPHVSSLLFPTA